jgi:hypothetical protein
MILPKKTWYEDLCRLFDRWGFESARLIAGVGLTLNMTRNARRLQYLVKAAHSFTN